MTTTPTKKRKSSSTDDSKGSAKKSRHKLVSKEKDEEFRVITTSLVLPISPAFANDPRAGVEEMLDSMVMKYIHVLQGVLVSHSNATFISKTAPLLNDCPYLVCTISFDATVWSPQIGMRLVGKISLCSPDHIALLLHRIFNVSIPRHHIPVDTWQFEHGPAENDPEYGPHVFDSNQNEMNGGGRWRHRTTGAVLGGSDGYLEFIVVGMTLANDMLSLHGSLLPDQRTIGAARDRIGNSKDGARG